MYVAIRQGLLEFLDSLGRDLSILDDQTSEVGEFSEMLETGITHLRVVKA